MDKTCPTCPFLAANKDKPTPTGFKCEAVNETDWYSQENIDGVWNITRHNPVVFLSCHTTDPDYYGKEGGKVYACVGATLLVFMHIKIFEKAGSYQNYIKVVGPDIAMSQKAMAEKAFALMLGRTSPLWGGMLLPDTLTLDIDTVRFPTGFKNSVKEFRKILKAKK